MNEKNIEFAKRLATQTLINFDTLTINDIKRRVYRQNLARPDRIQTSRNKKYIGGVKIKCLDF